MGSLSKFVDNISAGQLPGVVTDHSDATGPGSFPNSRMMMITPTVFRRVRVSWQRLVPYN
eukprot:640018-Hanusia_phi.AAC.1